MPDFTRAEVRKAKPSTIQISKLPSRLSRALLRLEIFINDPGYGDIYQENPEGILPAFVGPTLGNWLKA